MMLYKLGSYEISDAGCYKCQHHLDRASAEQKLKETEAEAYSAVWDLMIQIEKELPMAYVFYGIGKLSYQEYSVMLYNDLLRGSHMLGIICVAVAVSLCVVDILFSGISLYIS